MLTEKRQRNWFRCAAPVSSGSLGLMADKEPQWLALTRNLQAIAQNGLAFAEDPYDRERYRELRVIASRLMAIGASEEVEPIIELFSRDTGYTTPKVDVRGVVLRDERVLLVEERSDGHWALPGGWADPGLTPSACIEKEIREEAGLAAKVLRLLAVHDRGSHEHPPGPFSVYKLFFHCGTNTAEPTPGLETTAARFFALDKLPALSTGRVTKTQIEKMVAAARHPEWPAAFD